MRFFNLDNILLRNPINLFNSDNFKKATDDGFFISIEYKDPLFELDETKDFLESLGGTNIEEVIE